MEQHLDISTRKGWFRYVRGGGGAWELARTGFIGAPVTLSMTDPRDGAVYAALNHGHFGVKLHRSGDGGATWEELTAPAYPPKPEDWSHEGENMGRPVDWTLQQIWSLEPGGADQPGLIWCGTIPGGLFRSRDRGASWELIRTLWDKPERKAWFGGGYDNPGIHSICGDPRDSNVVTLGISCGGAWRTRDGGETWACCSQGMVADYMPDEGASDPNVQDPHRLAMCAAAPDHFWTQHHCGIFKCEGAGKEWGRVFNEKPSAFGFAVCVHPRDPQTAWFAPAVKDELWIPVDGKLVVTRTRDGGASFEALGNGLPQERAYDLIYRHCLDVDARGEALAMGSTTGNLWISENQGDTWSALERNLPPIYAVRFGVG